MRLLIPLLVLELLSIKGLTASQTIVINPDKRLKALISSDSMNRKGNSNPRSGVSPPKPRNVLRFFIPSASLASSCSGVIVIFSQAVYP